MSDLHEALTAEDMKAMRRRVNMEEKVIRTMGRLISQREKDGVCRINGELPKKQRQYMDSILKQAKAINRE